MLEEPLQGGHTPSRQAIRQLLPRLAAGDDVGGHAAPRGPAGGARSHPAAMLELRARMNNIE